MSTWVIVSWVFVVILTTINVIVFVKLKGASEQMLKMAFPGAKDMNDALSQMQKMMGGMGGGGMPRGGFGGPGMQRGPSGGMGGKGGPGGKDAQLKAAMDMLQNMQKNSGKKR